MPDLGWDIAETRLVQENQGNNDSHMTPPLQTLITVIIMLIAILEHIIYIKEIPKLAKKTAQAVKSTITKASHNELLQNIKDSYRTTMLVIPIVTNTKDRTNRITQAHTTKRNMQNYPGMRKLNDEYGRSY